MRIIFVRHGHPDYVHDCLTPLGHQHAAAAALRLQDEGVTAIYSSTCGRALETAGHLAEKLGLTVNRCDFMREISWGAAEGSVIPEGGHPWSLADRMIAGNEPLNDPDWAEHPYFRSNKLLSHVEHISRELDAWLAALGYTREGLYYRAGEGTDKTIAVFGHGGASAAILTHLFNLPFPYVCATMGPDFTGITIAALGNEPGRLTAPRFEIMNDARHIRDIRIENVYGN